jgi:hypothetical protein
LELGDIFFDISADSITDPLKRYGIHTVCLEAHRKAVERKRFRKAGKKG